MNQLMVTIIIILIPGIISTVISDKLTVHSRWDSFKYGLYSLVLGIFSYSSLQVAIYLIDIIKSCFSNETIWNHLIVWKIIVGKQTDLPGFEVALATLFSIPIAYITSWLVNFKFFNKIGQFFKITTKYGDENLFSYYLNAVEIDWIYVRDPEFNLTYQGRITSYSENQSIQEIVLSQVTVFRYKDSAELYSLPTIYLTKELGRFIIEAVPNEFLGE
jgi:hypothetical protein